LMSEQAGEGNAETETFHQKNWIANGQVGQRYKFYSLQSYD
jgi:hypothetical protein